MKAQIVCGALLRCRRANATAYQPVVVLMAGDAATKRTFFLGDAAPCDILRRLREQKAVLQMMRCRVAGRFPAEGARSVW